MAAFQGRVEEFISLPAHPLVLDAVLQRMETVFRLRRRVRSLSKNLESRARDSVREIIETERFLAVRQIVEKMSAVISQVASDAQGGMRYFNELPYFVSIHGRNCTVLAANNVYNRYMGNRLYQDSWGIYVGRRATRKGCPVGRTLRRESVMTTRALVRYASGVQVPVPVHSAPIYDFGEHTGRLFFDVFRPGIFPVYRDPISRTVRTGEPQQGEIVLP